MINSVVLAVIEHRGHRTKLTQCSQFRIQILQLIFKLVYCFSRLTQGICFGTHDFFVFGIVQILTTSMTLVIF